MRLLEWMLEHPQFVIILAGSFAYWLSERRKAKQRKLEEQQGEGQQSAPEQPVSDVDEQLRRIQEDIRRRIAERQNPKPQPTESQPPPIPMAPAAPSAPPPLVEAAPSAEEAPGPLAILRALAEQKRRAEENERLAEAERERAEALLAEQALRRARQSIAITNSEPAFDGAAVFRTALHNRESVRRAIVLGELLGPPKALR
jgi:hypothetical protein